MKRLFILITFFVLIFVARAQSSNAINRLFSASYLPEGKTSETVIEGDALKNSDLSVYRSMVIIDSPEIAEKLSTDVAACTKDALSREVKYIDGNIYYAQYMLAPISGKPLVNRYLFFLNSHLKGSSRIMLVYMAGAASPEQVRKLINGK